MLSVASVFRRTSVTWVRVYEYSGSNRNASRDAENLENRLISETLMLETGNSTVTPVVRNLRIDPAKQSPH